MGIITQEDKELLLTDLCARLRYGIKCHFKYGTVEGDIILKCIDGNVARFDYGLYGKFHVVIDPQYIKPYLRPMSSMTEEEEKELKKIHHQFYKGNFIDAGVFSANDCGCTVFEMSNILNYLRSRNFDYCGMIDRGLALEAPEGMYNIK